MDMNHRASRSVSLSAWFPLLTLLAGLLLGCEPDTRVQRPQKSLLWFSQQAGNSPPSSLVAWAQAHQVQLSVRRDSLALDEDSLWQYSSLLLDQLDGDSLPIWQRTALQRYVQAGNGLLLLSPQAPTPLTWPWLDSLLASRTAAPPAITRVRDDSQLPGLQQLTQGVGRVVLSPRAPWLAPGDSLLSALRQSLAFAMGPNAYDPAFIRQAPAPKPERFTRKVLDDFNVNEPMELTVLPDGKVIYIERRGKMKMYDPEVDSVRLLATFDVCINGNYEDGLLGLTIDPAFGENGYLYLYYSPGANCERPQTLSRFTMHQDSLILASEKIILEVPVQRETCCHSGGSLTFGPDGNLFLSTGDNTSSKESDGYTPIDERPGRGPFDAQKSSANTHDLRGKVLRILPNPYGSYTIPDGNLFPKDGSQGRPEIYAMGCRNPFRISVDAQTGWLYWGDVGPDVGEPGRYGPESYDEWNQAQGPGNFGWPYFVGPNYAYPDRDFAMDTVGPLFDPRQPRNLSPHNYGAKQLPPAQPAWMWYPYGESEAFPQLGIGSRSSMAGPVFRRALYPDASKVRFPAYYEGKLFIYEWARSWIKVVDMDSLGRIRSLEDFLPDMPLSKPIDLEFGPDGAMYLLEYGKNYFMNNPEARLVRIEYAEGNRLPVPALAADAPEGPVPHTVTFTATGSYDYDPADSLLQFLWAFTDSTVIQDSGEVVRYTFTEPGQYRPKLFVVDGAGDTAMASMAVRIGNAPPALTIDWPGNRSFYFGQKTVPYRVEIRDPEDEATGGISRNRAQVSWVYASEGNDLDVLLGGGGALPEGSMRYAGGLRLINGSDCATCHNLETRSIGPSYQEVSQRYLGDAGAVAYLAKKIITGGNGVWGEKIMAGHPQHSLEETRQMARYILSLAESDRNRNLPLQGEVKLQPGADPNGAYLLAATYTDGGANGLPAITRRARLLLRAPRLQAENYAFASEAGPNKGTFGPNREHGVARGLWRNTWIGFAPVDLTGIGAITLRYVPEAGGSVELRLDGPEGPLLAQGRMQAGVQNDFRELRLPIAGAEGFQALYLVFRGGPDGAIGMIDWLAFEAGEGGI